jgi:hypothetical protein
MLLMRLLILAVPLAGMFALSASTVHAATFTVDSTGNGQDSNTGDGICDDGTGFCTLRAAIEQANDDPAVDIIAFNIPTSDPGYISSTDSFRIQPASPLPVISSPAIIDGWTQSPQFVGKPVIELNGLFAGALVDGFRITAGDSTVRGLAINKFGSVAGSDGIELQSGGNNIIEGNFIGVDVTGTVTDPNPVFSGDEFGNAGSGVYINGSSGNTIGGNAGTTPGGWCTGSCNILSGAGRGFFADAHGVEIAGAGATGNVVKGNHIGLDAGGPEAGPLCTGNVDDDADGKINDGCPQDGATAEVGLQCANGTNDDLADDSLVNDGCPALISATKDLGNKGDGVNISGVASNTIGGDAAGEGNVITANNANGVKISGGVAASGNHMEGNFIGTTGSGASIPPPGSTKSFYGVLIDGAPGNVIGGTTGGAGNIVSANLIGIQIQGAASTGNLVQGNRVGIDVSGNLDLGNLAFGVAISNAANNTIGGAVGGARNIISGNDSEGIEITGTATGNLVQGNYIGTNAGGTGELGNGQLAAGIGTGVRVNNAPGNTIGGTTTGAGNVISGNIAWGIEIKGTANGTIVQGNYIGTNPSGTGAVANRKDGLFVNGAPNTIIGGLDPGARNVISGNGFPFVAPGITILGAAAAGTQVQGNLIGTDVSGTVDLGNGGNGVLIVDSPNTTVGGTSVAARNIISGNGVHGVEIDATGPGNLGNLVHGNYIGMDISGTLALGNTGDGIYISDAPGNTIGGTAAGAGNVISANGSMGVDILGSASSGNIVQGNYIGTDVTGGVDLGNGQHGVFINGAPTNTIGGTTTAARNVISGNGTGVYIQNGGATGNLVQGNRIGTNAAGTASLANTFDGVRVGGNASGNSVGGAVSGAGNTIGYNGAIGVLVDSGSGDSILSNSIFSNTTLGVNLGTAGVTANDTGDGDTGANNLQNFPLLSVALSGGGNTTVQGTLNSTASKEFTVQFFSNTACDSSGNGEGASLIGSATVLTNGSGDGTINSTFPGVVPPGQFITVAATDSTTNDTSEFSACQVVVGTGDTDGDGIPDSSDPDDDNDSNVPPGYTTCKGPCPGGYWRDIVELAVGTSPLDRCADTTASGDESDDKWPPDFDDNRSVNVVDFTLWRADYASPPKPLNPRADLDASGTVNVLDFGAWKPYFNTTCSP